MNTDDWCNICTMSITIYLNVFLNGINWTKLVIQIKSEGYFEFDKIKTNGMIKTLKQETQNNLGTFLF